MSTLLDLIQTKVNYVVQEAIVVIKDIFRKYPNKYVPASPSEGDAALQGMAVGRRKNEGQPLPSSFPHCRKHHSQKKPFVFSYFS